jgi:hypothetical protein
MFFNKKKKVVKCINKEEKVIYEPDNKLTKKCKQCHYYLSGGVIQYNQYCENKTYSHLACVNQTYPFAHFAAEVCNGPYILPKKPCEFKCCCHNCPKEEKPLEIPKCPVCKEEMEVVSVLNDFYLRCYNGNHKLFQTGSYPSIKLAILSWEENEN